MVQSSFLFYIMAWNSIKRLADAVFNDIVSGLRGYHQNMSMSKEQLEEEVVQMRLTVIKEYLLKGSLPTDDLLMSINCIPVDCESLDKCKCRGRECGEPVAHFQIPQIMFDFGIGEAIKYIGSSDKQNPFIVYNTSIDKIKTFQKYRKRGKNKPWVYIDVTPNTSGLLDCYIFGAPLIKQVSVIAVFKDPRQLEEVQCCGNPQEQTQLDNNFNFLDIIIKDRLTQQKLRYYRQYAAPVLPNDQEYSAG